MFSLRCKKAGLTLYVELAGELPRAVRGDLGKLRQVMINLVGNAVKFTDEGGIGIIVGPDAGKVRFSVTDSGKGIPSGELELIMQPFTQASTRQRGRHRPRLAISSRYVQMMGGSLSVQSEFGKGSTFSFAIELPETDEPVPASGEAPVAIALKKGTEVTALIVDDKELNRLVLKEMLGGAGFATIEAENGKVAYELARERKPDLVFMDIKMPVMDGYESMRLIREDEATRGIPVFALTASAFVNDERKILESGFAGFLAKPFKRSALFQLIRDRTGVELEYETVQPTRTRRPTSRPSTSPRRPARSARDSSIGSPRRRR
jgi:CheY-like chemotaxis protein